MQINYGLKKEKIMKNRVLILLLAICAALCFVACDAGDYVKDSTATLKSDDENYNPPIFDVDIKDKELGGNSYGEYIPIP